MPRLRIIPLTMTAALALLAVKLVDVMHGTQALSEQLLISKVEAQQPEATPETKEIPATPDAAQEEAKEGNGGKSKQNPNVSDSPGETVKRHYTAVEVELLQNLARRREELNRWETNIEIKESTLNATQKRIDDTIASIDAMKKEVSELLAQYNEKEDAKVRSLVKIYENMKPKEAARIFNEMEMPILLLVIDKMSEKKAAPVLAGMDPVKAKQITVELAEQRRVNNTRLSTLAPPPQPPKP